MTFDHWLDAIRNLRRDRSGGKPKPYKPLMLAGVVILIRSAVTANERLTLWRYGPDLSVSRVDVP